MKNTFLSAALCALAMLASPPLLAEETVITAAPVYCWYVNANEGLFTPLSAGGSIGATLPFALFGLSWLQPQVGAGLSYSELTIGGSMMAVGGQVGLAVRLPLVPWMDLTAALSARGTYYILDSVISDSGFSPGASADLGADFRLGDALSIGVGAEALYDFGMLMALKPYIAGSVHIGEREASEPVKPSAKPKTEKPAPLTAKPQDTALTAADAERAIQVAADGVFPVFYKYYEGHPFGAVTITNVGKAAWTDVTVTFSMKQFMDLPAVLTQVPSIKPSASAKIDMTALFNEDILSVTEATKVSGELAMAYTEGGKRLQMSRAVSLRVYDRNAMNWADDQRPAAFVTAKDPAVLGMAKNLAGAIGAARNPAISERLQVAAGVHEALCLYGINYVADPTGLFSGSKNKTDVDFLQFPRQTLEYKAGDCDDLSILYAAFFEAAGIETAFITVPDHILMAVSLNMKPAEAKERFSQYNDLIVKDDAVWLPMEITLRKGGFLAAWKQGIKEWREYSSRGQVAFLPVHEAWKTYEPVAQPGSTTLAPLPADKAVAAMKTEMESFITSEIADRVARLQAESRKAQQSSKAINSLGVLYARYGLYDKAKAQFESILKKDEYVPALLNLGNISMTRGDLETAQGYYNRAYKKAPTNTSVLLAQAMVNSQLENYGASSKYYQALRTADPALADRYSFLGLKGEEGTRAASAASTVDQIEWAEGK